VTLIAKYFANHSLDGAAVNKRIIPNFFGEGTRPLALFDLFFQKLFIEEEIVNVFRIGIRLTKCIMEGGRNEWDLKQSFMEQYNPCANIQANTYVDT
jgi:hypothetical protein